MARFSMTSNLDDVLKRFDTIAEKQIPFALMKAVNNTAFAVQKETKTLMQSVFDRPNPFTMSTFEVLKADAPAESVVAVVQQKDRAKTRPYLHVQETGGPRRQSKLEAGLDDSVFGFFDSPLRMAVPADGAQLDQYGNWNKGERQKATAAIGAFRDPLSNETAGSKKRKAKKNAAKFFVPKNGGLSPGIFRRDSDGTLRMILAFMPVVPTYNPIFPFHKNAERVMSMVFPMEFWTQYRKALRTARW